MSQCQINYGGYILKPEILRLWLCLKNQLNVDRTASLKRWSQDKPPYFILHKRGRILSMSNSIACAFDNIGPKCKMMYRFKISAFAGMTTSEVM